MPKTLRVLSVDFDFFQRVNVETLMYCYPDGIDLPPDLTTITWASHYNFQADRLKKVTVDRKRLTQLKQIIRNQNPLIKVMVVSSHVHIYDFILSNMPGYDQCDIINIDMHHDMFNNNNRLDCGNWVTHIKKAIPNCNITWIANKISNEVYGLKDLPVKYEFDDIMDKTFDLLFLCRSDTWLPPHLDKNFAEVVRLIQRKFPRMLTDGLVYEQRDISKAVSFLQQNHEQHRQLFGL